MRALAKTIGLLACSCGLAINVCAQDSYNSRNTIGSDYDEVAMVVRVNISRVQQKENLGGYSTYEVVTRVVETYKGKLKPKQEFVYYITVESGYAIARYRGQKIVFLNQAKSNTGEIHYVSLENSDREPTQRVISILRDLRMKHAGKKS